MKFLIRVTILELFLFAALFAAGRSANEIKSVALHWAQLEKPSSQFQISSYKKYPTFTYFTFKPKGWVIVSHDDTVKPILGYNLEQKIDLTKKVPKEIESWLNSISQVPTVEQIIEHHKHNGFQSSENSFKKEWEELVKPHSLFTPNLSSTIVAPLEDAKWDQGKYYNQKCPKDSDGPDGHVYVGCVATAMGQIMYYHKWPKNAQGNHSYYHDTYGTISANFKTSYDWSAMANQLYNYNNSVAKLLYHAGVAVDMDYSADGSGAYPSKIAPALQKYFKYTTSGLKGKNNYSDSQWNRLLQKDLNNKQPILYVGYSSSGGHAFNIDGYKRDNSSYYYHFNWGWSGYFNGWFTLSSQYYPYYQMAVMEIASPEQKSAIVNILPAILSILLQ